MQFFNTYTHAFNESGVFPKFVVRVSANVSILTVSDITMTFIAAIVWPIVPIW